MQNTGERQVAPTLAGIRKDHTARYQWAAGRLAGKKVYDIGCGVGYGARIMADAGATVMALDRSAEAIEYAKTHYRHDNVRFTAAAVEGFAGFTPADAAVCFEMLEHLEDPRPLLKKLSSAVPLLLASVPNEEVFPWAGYAHHYRHYTRKDFLELLQECGWRVIEWYGQQGAESPVEEGANGRTLIAVAVPSRSVVAAPPAKEQAPRESVAIVGLGPSKHEYVSAVCGAGDRRKLFQETWVINAAGSALEHDLLIHMDDIRVQEIRAAAKPDGNIAALVTWLKSHNRPILTSRAYPDYPATVEMPLEEMINGLTYDYFNNTAAWAMAYAIHRGVKKVGLFGCDYSYANRHDAEKGRACLEFWMGYGAAKGVRFTLARSTTLMDACEPRELRLYGYDTRTVNLVAADDGGLRVEFTEKEPPTAEEIEWRYDHNRHPNSIAEELEDAA